MPQRVVIIGGGFGGLATAKALRGTDTLVTVVDRSNHHLFQPLLYQVATAGLAPSDIAEPIRSVLARQRNASVRLGEVTSIDKAAKRVTVRPDGGPETWLEYDYLVVAAGVKHAYFGNDGWAEHAPGLKTIGDALEIRRRLLTAFERAEWAEDEASRRALLTFVIVGAGPTGVELAGTVAEIAFSTLRRDFRHVDTREARVVLVEASAGVLGAYPEGLQASARRQLEGLGVEVRTGTRVSSVDATGVTLDGEPLAAATVLWAAGVQASPLAAQLGVDLDRAGRVPVSSDCTIQGHSEVFVVGDMALFTGEDGSPLPGVAPVAQSQGRHVAKCIAADLAGSPRRPYRYLDKGNMATIGRSRAVLWSGRIQFGGIFAWLAWVFVHLLFLVTFRNRLLVFLKWAWAWATFERASRLIWQQSASAQGRASHEEAA
ncbi:MAG: NADH dehydrogenase [Myxococcota bacterium]